MTLKTTALLRAVALPLMAGPASAPDVSFLTTKDTTNHLFG